jgi:hypothetical protein
MSKTNTKGMVIRVQRKRPDGTSYDRVYLVRDAEDMDSPEKITALAAEMFGDARTEFEEHPTPPPSVIAFP